jgi:sterol desaturase/sphingolipid hydroxylase (fatty acid hydroxylase superfamily)
VWLKAAVFWAVWVPFTLLIALTFRALWAQIGVQPLLPSLAPAGLPRIPALVIGALAAAVVGDFFYYWCHRAQHRFFWRFHAVHHSVREMSGTAAYHHVTEEVFKLALYVLPLGFFTTDPYAIPVLGALLGLHGNYLHSPIRIHFGRFGRVIQDNRFHRIHHSIEPRHYDKNFGVFVTLWDQLFGTAYFPAPGEWPQTGAIDMPEPTTIGEFLLAPFAKPRGAELPAAVSAE